MAYFIITILACLLGATLGWKSWEKKEEKKPIQNPEKITRIYDDEEDSLHFQRFWSKTLPDNNK